MGGNAVRCGSDELKMCGWTSSDSESVSDDIDDSTSLGPDVIELVVQLSMRMGMIMEDASPLALNASPEGLEERIATIAREVRTLASISEAAQRLVRQ